MLNMRNAAIAVITSASAFAVGDVGGTGPRQRKEADP